MPALEVAIDDDTAVGRHDRLLHLLPAAVAVAFGVVYLIAGPGFILDDWWALGNAHFDDWWMAAGEEQWRARPGAAAVYALEFGLLGPHPLLIATIQLAVVATTAVLLGRLLAGFVGTSLRLRWHHRD